MSRPSARRGSTPARTSDDFPLPEPPTTATTCPGASRPTSSSTSSSRPKKRSWSPGWNAARPGYGGRAGSGGTARPSASTASTRLGLVETGEPMWPEVDEVGVGGQVAGRQPGGGGRDEHLSGIGETADAGDLAEGRAEVVAVGGDGFAGVCGTVNLHPAPDQVALQVDPGPEGIAGAMENGHGGVALDRVADPPPTMALHGPVDHEQMFGQQARARVRRVLPQAGRGHDVGGEEGEHAGRQRLGVPARRAAPRSARPASLFGAAGSIARPRRNACSSRAARSGSMSSQVGRMPVGGVPVSSAKAVAANP